MLDIKLRKNAIVSVEKVEGTQVYTPQIYARDVEYIICQHQFGKFRKTICGKGLRPGFFHLKVKGRTRKNRWKTISFRSKLHSFLAYTVASLTGHKVQGATLDAIIVGSWGRYKYGAQGWLNVIL